MACVGFETIKGFLHSQEMIAVNRVQRSLKVSLEIQKLQVSVLILIGEATAMLESDTIQGKQGSSYIGTESQILHPSESGCKYLFIILSYLVR